MNIERILVIAASVVLSAASLRAQNQIQNPGFDTSVMLASWSAYVSSPPDPVGAGTGSWDGTQDVSNDIPFSGSGHITFANTPIGGNGAYGLRQCVDLSASQPVMTATFGTRYEVKTGQTATGGVNVTVEAAFFDAAGCGGNLITAGSQGKNILMADLADGAWESAEILSPPFDIAPLPSPLSAELRLVTKRVGTNSDTLSVFFDTAYLAVNCQLPPTTATVGGPQAICVNGTTTGLGGNTPMTGNGAWSIVSGGVTGAFNPKASFPNAAFTHSSGTGPVTLRWTISSAPCADSTADVVVTVKQPPTTATVGDKQTICADSASAPLGGNMPASGTGSWSLVSGGKGNFSNVSDPNATFTPTSGSGPFVVRWTISSGPCADSWADVTLTLETDLPVVTAPSDITVTQTLCE